MKESWSQQKYKNIGIYAKNGAATRDGVREHKSHIWDPKGPYKHPITSKDTPNPVIFTLVWVNDIDNALILQDE